MKIIKKPVAVALSALMVGSALSGCAQATVFGKYPNDYSWSYKDDNSTLSIGTYILYQYMAYYDASLMLNNATGDFLDKVLKDEDGKEIKASDYISAETDKTCRHNLYVNKLFNDMGLKLTPQQIAEYKANTDSTWAEYSTAFESFGISKESFVKAYGETPMKQQAVFEALYLTEGGDKEVKLDEIKKEYTDNYVNYSLFSVQLYTETTGEDDALITNKLSDDDIKAVKADLQKYVDDVNGGKTFEDAVNAYMADYGIESDPSYTATNKLDKSGLPDEVVTALEGMKDKEATYITIGEDGKAPICYVIYRGDIQEEVKNIESDNNLKTAIVSEMKLEEFKDETMKAAKSHKCEVNKAALEKYPMTMFVTEPPTEASTQASTEVFTGAVQ